MQFSSFRGICFILLFIISSRISFIYSQPVSNRPDISIKQLGTVSANSVRITYDPSTGNLYTLQTNGDIKRVNFNGDSSSVTFTTIYRQSDHGLTGTLGMAFGTDGSLYVVGNQANGSLGVVTIARGVPVSSGSEERIWFVLAQTEQYNYGSTYNHRASGIIVAPDNNYIYVNSGARTDHGEERDNLRETGLTSVILKLPADGDSITLQNDREWLRANGYILAEGTRNSFDFAYAANGDLFATDNSGDRDDPEELNWIREGHHYGFPWRIGGNNTPQQYLSYDPMNDPLLSPNAWGGGDLYATFYNDPDYPAPPEGITFTDPVQNSGPDADKFRDTLTGDPSDASDLGKTIGTFTTHRSPNGLVFDKDSLLAGDLAGSGFVISLNTSSLAVPLGDTGEDILQVTLTKNDSGYTAQIVKLVTGFNDPLGIEMTGNKLYVLETGLWFPANQNPRLYELVLPSGVTGVSEKENLINTYELYRNYPNPFNPSTKIKFSIPERSFVNLAVYDILGNEVAVLVNDEKPAGIYEVEFSSTGISGSGNLYNLSSGIYFYRLNAGGKQLTRKMILMK